MSVLAEQGGAAAYVGVGWPDEGQRVQESADSLLVRLARLGDNTACQELIRRYQDRIYTVAYNCVQDHEEALDITQDTFLRMLEGLPRFREEANFYTWLYRIAVNRCIDWRRSRIRRPPPRSLDDLVFEEGLEPADARAELCPHDALETKELREQIETAIAAVPEPFRMVVVLADVQGLSIQEIAHIMRCPGNTVKTRLHRGRLVIRKRLESYLKGEDHDLS